MWSVLLVFLSSLDRNLVKGDSVSNALDTKKSNKETFCSKVSAVEDKFLYAVSDGAEVVRSLVTTAGTLVHCSITGDSEQVVSFTRECVPERTDGTKAQRARAPYERMDEARRLCERFTNESQQSSNPTDQVHSRAKRGFTYPGTLWCGAGNMADNYNQLGDFAETDSCCRTHDHCPHVIHAFSSNYGYTNFKWHSISHCACDEALKACLRKVNDTSSRVVGQAFFNVIEAPCFDFGYEEQCVERHWYGLCKKFEKRPIAVLKEAVPYDFGGIDVIDELTVAPSRKKDSNQSGETMQPETTTQSPVSQPSSPEEPSLRNVVTAAEDFIKVLATVSTSQSSTADSDKGDAQGSEKKKKKTSEKKKKSKKTKGKGRKKKKQQAVVKIEDSGAVPLSSPTEEKTVSLSNFISESKSPEQPGRPSNRMNENEYELGGREQTSNEVMKDAPALDEEAVSITPPNPTKKKAAKKNFLSTLSSAVSLQKAKRKWLRRQKKVKTAPSELETTTETSNPQDQTIPSVSEQKLNVNTGPTEIPKAKRNRSKLKKDEEKRKKRLKASAASSPAVNENVEDNWKVGDRLVTATPKQQLPQEADGGGVTLHPSFTELKRQKHRSHEKGIAKKRRKGSTSLNRQLPQHTVEEAIIPTPTGALKNPALTTAGGWFTEDTQTTKNWQLFPSTTSVPSVKAKRLLNKRRGKTKNGQSQSSAMFNPKAVTAQRRPSKPTAITGALTTTGHSVQSPQPTTSALSPMQLTVEKVKEQFERKRKRKLAISLRQP